MAEHLDEERAYLDGYQRGQADAAARPPAERVQDVLLWARANRFRVREIRVGDVRLVVDDLGDQPPPEKPGPRSAHEAFARELGISYSEDDDAPDPVEGQG